MLTYQTFSSVATRVFLAASCAAAALVIVPDAHAEELLRIPTSAPVNGRAVVEAILKVPTGVKTEKPYPAVILLHSGGGWDVPLTGQYAKALNQAGFATLELRLFKSEDERVPAIGGYLQNLYDALRFLGSRPDIKPDRVSVAGFSHGGYLALTSATSWAYDRFGGGTGSKFAAHAPFYPVCYTYAATARARRANGDVPGNLLFRWTGVPVRIFAGGKDDYDDQDPKACEEFVSLIPERHRSLFSVVVYPDATHGWDQPSNSFFARVACKGRGCTNRNVANPAVTEQSVAELVKFVGENGR